MSESTIQKDVPGVEDEDAAVLAAIEAKFTDEAAADDKASEEPAPKEGEEASEEPAAKEGEESEPDVEAADTHKVRIKVGEEDHLVPVADLKRLWGQEKALTQRSQEVAAVTQRATDEGEKAVALVSAMLQKAEKTWAQYQGVDLNLAAQRLPEDAYKQLRSDMTAAWQDVQFLRQDANQFLNTVRANREVQHREAMAKVDTEIAKTVHGWTAESRKEVIDYAVKQGLNKAIAESLSDPAAILIVRKAMSFDKGAAAVAKKVSPVAATTPKMTLKPGAKGAAPTTAEQRLRDAKARLRESGTADDAADVFSRMFGGE